MQRISLTDAKVAALALRVKDRPVDIADARVIGLTVRIRPGGSVSYYMRWRARAADGASRFRRVRLDAAGVDEAREKAIAAKGMTKIGRDPATSEAALTKSGQTTIEQAAATHYAALRREGRAERYVKLAEALITNHLPEQLRRRRLVDLRRQDLSRVYASMLDAGLRSQVNRLHTQVQAVLARALRDRATPACDAHGMERPVKKEPSDQRREADEDVVLASAQVARLWLAVEAEPQYVRNLIRLLCLLPMRRQELGDLQWSEVRPAPERVFDGETYAGAALDLASPRMKGKRRQVMPLPSRALALIEGVPRGADGDFVFSGSAGRKPFSGWRALRLRLQKRLKVDLPEGWTFHGLRSAIATGMGCCDVDEAVIARLLHHSESARRGVTVRYDRARRLVPMAQALDVWDRELMAAIERVQAGGAEVMSISAV